MNQTEVRFYHLQKVTLAQALPRLLEKIYAKGMKTKVLMQDAEDIKTMDQSLWTYSTSVFLPHGSAPDSFAQEQPIWLTTGNDNPNDAEVLVVCRGADPGADPRFKIICFIFDGTDPDNLAQARARWLDYQQKDYNLSYWQQNDKGAWEATHLRQSLAGQAEQKEGASV